MAKDIRKQAREVEQDIEDRIEANEPRLIHIGSGLLLFVAGAGITAIGLLAVRPSSGPPDLFAGGPSGPGPAAVTAASFSPPPVSAIPAGAEGDAIKRAIDLFDNTGVKAAPYVGDGLACKNCHLDAGRKAGASPMWAAWVAYPQFRKKTGSISTMEDRIRGCFMYSMNAQNSPSGGPPPPGSPIYSDMETYFAWLAKGAPVGAKLAGGGFPPSPQPAGGYDPVRGKAVFQQYCIACHGNDGQGARQSNGQVVYPPLWGPHSFNWGAGMAVLNLAASFIKANMPFGQTNVLSDQQAWDVAAYIDSQERPKDPRQTGTVAQNAAKNFTGFPTYYGKTVDGHALGTGVAGAGPFAAGK